MQALVAQVLKRVGEYTAKQIASREALRLSLNDVTRKIGGSKLGVKTADWFRDNFEKIRTRLEERRRTREKGQGSKEGDEDALGSQPSKPKSLPVQTPPPGKRYQGTIVRGVNEKI